MKPFVKIFNIDQISRINRMIPLHQGGRGSYIKALKQKFDHDINTARERRDLTASQKFEEIRRLKSNYAMTLKTVRKSLF